MIDFSNVLIFYFILIIILIYLYINLQQHRVIISGVVSILSSSTIALGLLNYVNSESIRQDSETKHNTKNYIDFISGSFDKIDNFYITNPKELHSLFYEFYGYNNFPEKYNQFGNTHINETHENEMSLHNNNNNNDDNDNASKTKDISPIEYITLLKIIQYIEIIFIVNPNIFQDINFRNRIINYTNSSKFKKVLSYNKNNYSVNFIKKLDELHIIKFDDIEVENIPIPKLNRH